MSSEVIQSAIRALVGGELTATTLSYTAGRGVDGECNLFVYEEGDFTVLICSERAGNPGLSVTNAAPAPWQCAEDEISLREKVIWLEHYGPASDGRDRHDIDQVTVDRMGTARWRRITSLPVSAAA